jgi:HrpA-like RNA helicase
MHFLQQPCKNFGNSVNLVTKAVETCVMIHEEYESGDILVFLTGQEEIETFVSLLNETPIKNSRTQILCLPIYANLPFDQ